MWKGKRVLVTGGSGLIGKPLIRRLTEEGATVLNYDLTEHCSILNRDALGTAMIGHQVVFHLAAVSGVEESCRMGYRALETNIMGTLNVLEAAKQTEGIEAVIVASSNHIYGDHDGRLTEENASLKQLDTYSVSKTCADYLARCYAHNYGLATVVIRNTNCFGPGNDHPEHLVEGTIISCLKQEVPTIRGTGQRRKSFLYVDDVVDAFIRAGEYLMNGGKRGQAFNIAGQPRSVWDIVVKVLRVLNHDVNPIIMGQLDDQADENLDSSQANTLLGWHHQTPLEEGIRKTALWYSAHPKTIELEQPVR